MKYRFLAISGFVLIGACGSVKKNNGSDASTGDDGPPAEAAPRDCPVGVSSVCDNNTLTSCDADGAATGTETCALGCAASGTACKQLTPSNGLGTAMQDSTTVPPLVLTGDATIDTTVGTITDSTGTITASTSVFATGLPVPVFIIKASSMKMDKVTITGTNSVAFVSDGAILINGEVSVSAVRHTSGPGAVLTCQPATPGSNSEGRAGGGGGGFGTAGAAGGTGGSPLNAGGAAGQIAGNAELVPLRGGCPGAHAGGQADSPDASPDPGGGGGAIQIVSNTSVTIVGTGAISSNGAGGKGNSSNLLCLIDNPCGTGEAGGSGGAILIEAPVVDLEAGAGLFANGGGGSCNVTGSAQSGMLSTAAATGQTCTAPNGSGGNGSTGTIAATPGGSSSGPDSVGGGGGGGAGRIRVNVKTGTTFTPFGMLSPPATTGTLVVP